MIQTLKRKLGVRREDKNNTPNKLAADVAKIMKTVRITPHGVKKMSPFEARMGRKQNILFSTLAASSSPD